MVFFDGFYKYLVCTIDGNMALFQANLEHLSDKFENATILSALGEIVIGLLQNDQMLIYANQELKETSEDSAVCRQRKLFLNWFKLANRFVEITLPNGTPVSILATMTMTSALSVIYKLFMICRFMRLSSFHFKANPAGQHQVTSRYLSRST
jgi:telomere-associated protein RIF1